MSVRHPSRRAPSPPTTLAHLSDEELDLHLAFLDCWLEFELQDIADAVAERNRRSRATGGPGYVLSPGAEEHLARRMSA